MKDRANRKQIIFSLGVFLAMQGVNLMAICKVLIGRNLRILTPAVMLLTLLVLTDWDRVYNLRFARQSRSKSWLLLYLFAVTVLSFFSGYDLTQPSYGFVYQLIYLLTIMALWNQVDPIDGDIFLRMFFYLSGILCFAAMMLIIINYHQTGDMYFQGLGREADGSIITRATTGGIAILTFASVLSFQARNVVERVLRILFLLMSLFVIFVSRRRSVYMYFLVMLLYWYWYSVKGAGMRWVSRKTLIRAILFVLFMIGLLSFLMLNSVTREIVDRGIHSLTKGITTYIGRTEDDIAALYRHERLIRVPKLIVVDSTIWQFLLGYGYMYEWLDIPLLQVFQDLGLIGGTLFTAVAIVLPIKMMIKRTKNNAVLLVCLMSITQIIGCFTSGLPYASAFFPIALLYYVSDNRQEDEWLS